ncbi:MAG: histidine phosphatase family protein, partial [Bacteroidota bacterium]|nr:histidine phosphatase family protein [Bacteroidota bacterium]
HLQAQTSTYILLRHAEKDTSQPGATRMNADPPLTRLGRKRAESLIKVLHAYTPDRIYSTPYLRTRSTVTPLAEKFHQPIESYDPKQLEQFSKELLALSGKTIVVAGHSNTTPALVNLLIHENRYPPLDESVYNQLWIVTVKDGKTSVIQITY